MEIKDVQNIYNLLFWKCIIVNVPIYDDDIC